MRPWYARSRPSPCAPGGRAGRLRRSPRERHALRDGAPTQIVSGSFHYARAPRELWRDRLQRMRALGLSAVQTYVQWNWHETEEDPLTYGAHGCLQIWPGKRICLLLRLGPYICGEWEFADFLLGCLRLIRQ